MLKIDNLHVRPVASVWFRGMCRVGSIFLMLASLPATASAVAIPLGVSYKTVDESTNLRASQALSDALGDPGGKRFGKLIGTHRDSPPVLVGNFLSTVFAAQAGFDRNRLGAGILKYELTPDLKLDAQIFAAETKKQRRYLSELLQEIVPTGTKPNIRKLSKEELAVVWRLISWDIEEPIFVAEWQSRKFIFDLDRDSLALHWVEDLSAPCFSLHQEDREVLPCHCMVAAGEGLALSVVYEKRPELDCSHNTHAGSSARQP